MPLPMLLPCPRFGGIIEELMPRYGVIMGETKHRYGGIVGEPNPDMAVL